ncbi:MAG: hypothetical protein K8I27_11065 [Planctomycetes bacterium]|nr:hypothetical protein [Planctomycetota bacterium]
MNSPTLPYISYSPKRQFCVCVTPHSSRATWLAVKHVRKHRSFVYDANGKHWEEIWTVDDRAFGLFARMFNLIRPIEFSFTEAAPITVKEMTKILCAIIDNDPDDLWCQWMTHGQVKRRLRRQKTPGDLICFAGDLGLTEFNREVYGDQIEQTK